MAWNTERRWVKTRAGLLLRNAVQHVSITDAVLRNGVQHVRATYVRYRDVRLDDWRRPCRLVENCAVNGRFIAVVFSVRTLREGFRYGVVSTERSSAQGGYPPSMCQMVPLALNKLQQGRVQGCRSSAQTGGAKLPSYAKCRPHRKQCS